MKSILQSRVRFAGR